jgi:O-Antigen ligase
MIWHDTVALVAERPLLGTGPSGFVDAIAQRHGATWYLEVGPGTVLDSPHNWVLQAAVAGGVPLLVTALALVVVVLVLAARSLRGAATESLVDGGARFDILSGSLAAVIGLGAGLLTHFTAASTGVLLGLLLGVLTATRPGSERISWRRARTALFAAWLVAFTLLTAADIPLAAGIRAATAAEALEQFGQAQALRPWDADLTSIAAQSLTARVDAGDAEAVSGAVSWAERAATALPRNLAAQYTLGVAWRSAGDVDAAMRQFSTLHEQYRSEPRVQMQLGVTLIVAGQYAAGFNHLERAQAASPEDKSIRRMLEWAASVRG